jgi:fatty-acyl-CoA synthase
MACIVVRQGASTNAEELKTWLAERTAKWWVPERWSFIDEVPKTSVGKFDKKAIRASLANRELP